MSFQLRVSTILNFIFVDGIIECTPEDVLVFFSGSNNIPPIGYDKQPVLMFVDGPLATASTCDAQLRIPIRHGNYTKFQEALILSIHGSDGFGGV